MAIKNNKNNDSKRSIVKKPVSLVTAFLPVISTYIMEIISYLAVFALIIIMESRESGTSFTDGVTIDSVSDIFSVPFYAGILSFIRYTLVLIVCGFWYHSVFYNDAAKNFKPVSKSKFVKLLKPANIIIYVILGYSLQLLTDGILTLLANVFPTAFSNYSDLISSMNGENATILMTLTVILIAPVAEEVVFRGLTLKYAEGIFPYFFAAIFQGVIFGIYHGSIIQGIYAFLIGTFMGIIVIKTESILSSIILHIIINASSYLVPSALFASNIKAAAMTIIAAALVVITILFLNSSLASFERVENDDDSFDASANDESDETCDDGSDETLE